MTTDVSSDYSSPARTGNVICKSSSNMRTNQFLPLSERGKHCMCTESQLSDILQAKVTLSEKKPESDVFIMGESAMLNTLPPHSPKIFDEHGRKDIFPRVQTYGNAYRRTDIVFDVYWHSSVKSEARSKWGK